MMSELMGQHRFDLIRRIVLKQSVSQNDASRRSQPGKRGICLFALLRQMPFVNATDPGSGALAQSHQAQLQIFIMQRLKFIEDGKQQDRSQLRHQDRNPQKSDPRHQPPMCREIANDQIEQLDQACTQNRSQYQTFDFIPNPRSQLLI